MSMAVLYEIKWNMLDFFICIVAKKRFYVVYLQDNTVLSYYDSIVI